MKSWTFSIAQEADQEALFDFFKVMVPYTFKSNGLENMDELIQEELEEKRHILSTHFECAAQVSCFLMAKVKDEIVGTIAYVPAGSLIDECTKGALTVYPEIGSAFVHPDYQGQGMGKALFLEICQVLKSRKIETACWDSGYPMAQKIWCHIFGEPQYHIKDFWGENAPHFIWHMTVDEIIQHLEK